MIITGIISIAAVAIGFAGYFSYLFGGQPMMIAVALIAILSALNYWGIKESAEFNTIATLIEMSGLVIVAIIGIMFFNPTTNYFEMSSGWNGVITATAMIFFAYLGFEEVANIAEETKNAKKNIPKALLISIAVSTVLYILVSISCIGVLGWEKLAASKAPLADVASKAMPNAGIVLAFIALFATSNTVLAVLIVMSRMLYGVSRQHSLPKILSKIDSKRCTPYVSVFLVGILSIAALTIGNLETVAMLTNLGIFMIYIAVNASLIKLRLSGRSYSPGFRSPVNVGKFPVLALLGVVTSSVMLLYTMNYFIAGDSGALLLMVPLIIIGYAIYRIFNRAKG
jgi:basic amino acid/polyamine antiporter, APA family